MLHSSTKKLIDRLAEMTELGKLDWTEGDDGNIIYSTEGYSVVLSGSADQIVITSIDGKELERAEASDLSVSHNDAGTSYSEIVAAMTSEANRIALGTETAISTLLAGMEEPEIEEPEPEMVAEAPEDAVNEATALVEETPEQVEADAAEEAVTEEEVEVDPEPEVEAEAEVALVSDVVGSTEDYSDESVAAVAAPSEDAAEVEDLEADEEADAEPDLEATEASVDALEEEAPVNVEDTADDTSTEEVETTDSVSTFSAPEAEPEEDVTAEDSTPDTAEAAETLAHDVEPVESESELTEAVARLADEVNNRDASGLDAAAATAVGAVAMAAGVPDAAEEDAETSLDAAEEAVAEIEIPDPTEVEAEAESEAETENEVVTAPLSKVAYVPFGSEEVSVSEDTTALDSPVEIAASEDNVVEEPVSETADPEIETPELEPETVEATEPDFVSVDADLEPSTPAPTTSFGTFMSSPASETPVERESTPEPEAEPETIEAAAEVATPEPEPVAATTDAEPPTETPAQSYSLSGIGAGFGLGALSAKTEASGIPGPTASPADPEKIIIDATDDVLPEPEGQSTLPPLSGDNSISFGNSEGGDTAVLTESAADADTETDILKPRTRFNPWD